MMRHALLKLTVLSFFMIPGLPAFAGYDLPYIGEMQEYRTRYEDTFIHIARDYNLGFTELRAANPFVDPWLPGRGTKLIMPTRHILPDAPREGVVINLADMRLYAFVNGDAEPYTTAIGVGREGLNTPEGTTTIVRKKEGPIWTPTPRMRKEKPELKPFYLPGPENPMGTHALYLGWPTYALHGTNKPFGIGRRVSSGCIRLYPEAIVKVFDIVPVGTKVTVVNQPIKTAWIDNQLFLEVTPTLEQSVAMEEMGKVPEVKISDSEMRQIIKVAGEYEDRLQWPIIRKALKERNGYPVAIARRPNVEIDESELEDEKPQEVSKGKTADEPQGPSLADKTQDALEKIYVAEDEAASESEQERVPGTVSYKTLNN